MTVNGKVIVIGTVLAQTQPFRLFDIVEETGLDKQLVFKHLMDLSSLGALEKTGRVYAVISKALLLENLKDAEKRSRKYRLVQSIFWDRNTTSKIKETSTNIARARSLGLPDSLEMKKVFLAEIDKTIKTLKDERRYLAGANLSAKLSAQHFNKDSNALESLYTLFCNFEDFHPTATKQVFIDFALHKLDELL